MRVLHPMSYALSFLAFTAFQAGAVPVLPGDYVHLFGTDPVSNPDLAGPIIQNVTAPWEQYLASINPSGPDIGAGGTVISQAVQSAALARMIFGSQIKLDYNESDFNQFTVTDFTLTGYAGWTTDVDFRVDGGGSLLQLVHRSADGDSLQFILGNPGLTADPMTTGLNLKSAFTSILTDAEGYLMTGTMLIHGYPTTDPEFGTTLLITGLPVPYYKEMPVSTVPLPATLPLMLAGLGALLGMARRRRGAA